MQSPMIDQIADFLKDSNQLTLLTGGAVSLAFIASGLVLIPRIVLCLLAGAAYGLVTIPIAVPSITLGALLAFLTSRYLAADFVQRLLGRQRLLRSIAHAVDQEGWRIVALIRFASPMPGVAANYLFGLTNISWWSYAWATFVFCSPQIILFVCLGAAGREAMSEDTSSILNQVLIGIGVISAALTIFLVARRARSTLRALDEADRVEAAAATSKP